MQQKWLQMMMWLSSFKVLMIVTARVFYSLFSLLSSAFTLMLVCLYSRVTPYVLSSVFYTFYLLSSVHSSTRVLNCLQSSTSFVFSLPSIATSSCLLPTTKYFVSISDMTMPELKWTQMFSVVVAIIYVVSFVFVDIYLRLNGMKKRMTPTRKMMILRSM